MSFAMNFYLKPKYLSSKIIFENNFVSKFKNISFILIPSQIAYKNVVCHSLKASRFSKQIFRNVKHKLNLLV
ncbi:hypothetical protein BpHYR1_020710 [Brachionus plicatilis]|uniref:Uncharacterized protein n=1 Tax=Brachionus plicatilis TaxID=10195 RepID=A0A3M7PQF4_BRAPC|nr:hypothetical protein BpHYR1_020710 [Brachionus plicatilis]